MTLKKLDELLSSNQNLSMESTIHVIASNDADKEYEITEVFSDTQSKCIFIYIKPACEHVCSSECMYMEACILNRQMNIDVCYKEKFD